MKDIKKQCYDLYMSAFNDDEEFTKLLFNIGFENSCYYLLEEKRVVSMLFAFDVYLNGFKGKYVYGVATDRDFRGKGYMRRLFSALEKNLDNSYKFLCLRPMNEQLFEFYDKLNFVKKFYKKDLSFIDGKINFKGERINDTNLFCEVRNSLLGENSVRYGEDFIKLLLSYCDVLTDSYANPGFLVVKEKESGKIKEVLGNMNLILNDYTFTENNEFCYAVYKSLEYNFEGKGYLGLAMD